MTHASKHADIRPSESYQQKMLQKMTSGHLRYQQNYRDAFPPPPRMPGRHVHNFPAPNIGVEKHWHLPVSQSSHSWSVWQRHLVLDWTWTKKQHENCNKMKQQLFMTFITIHSLHCIIWTHYIPPTSKFLESEEFHTSTILWIVSISLVRLPRNLPSIYSTTEVEHINTLGVQIPHHQDNTGDPKPTKPSKMPQDLPLLC